MGKTGSVIWIKIRSKKNSKGYHLVKKGMSKYKKPGPNQKYTKDKIRRKLKRSLYSLKI